MDWNRSKRPFKGLSPKTARSIHQIIVSAMKPTNAYHSSSEYGKTTQKFFQIPSNSLKAQETRLISLEISRERSGKQRNRGNACGRSRRTIAQENAHCSRCGRDKPEISIYEPMLFQTAIKPGWVCQTNLGLFFMAP